MAGVSKAMAGVQKEMSKAAAQLPQHSKYAHHLTTESYMTTAAREARYMCARALARLCQCCLAVRGMVQHTVKPASVRHPCVP